MRFSASRLIGVLVIAASGMLDAAEPPPPSKAVLKITPGKVIVPTDAMRRIWGELVSVDLPTRTGTFRREGTDEVLSFTVLPYAELLHHATFGDLQDFRIGERAIFRLHENEAGQWVWLTYIQDEMNFLNGHGEYYHVEAIDDAKATLTCADANSDKSFVRATGLVIATDADTRYWKEGQPAKFSDIRVGDKLRTKTHGVGNGVARVAWEIFLDDVSLVRFQDEQKALHTRRLAAEGAPGYLDSLADGVAELTLFQESGVVARGLKPGQKIRLAAAGVDRLAIGSGVPGTVTAAKMAGNLGKATVKLDAPTEGFQVGGVVRLWVSP